MKALTIWQPWASLIAVGAKRYETRSWPAPKTLRPGDLLAIHAAKKPDGFDVMMRGSTAAADRAFWALDDAEPDAWTDGVCHLLPLGHVVAVCMFDLCFPTVDIIGTVSQDELLFGDWSEGRWAWRLRLRHRLSPPIVAKDQQGLWEWEPPDWLQRELSAGYASGAIAGERTVAK